MEAVTGGAPKFKTPMAELCENEALDIVEEEAFKSYLDTQGITPGTFAGKSDAEALGELTEHCRTWERIGAREACHLAAEKAPENGVAH